MEDFDPETIKILSHRAKAELRKRMLGVRGALSDVAAAERAARIVEALRQREDFGRARRVALFYPMLKRREVDLRPLHEELVTRGAEVYYPRTDTATKQMSFCRVHDFSELCDRPFGLLEPPAEAPVATELDWIAVPALCVAPSGYRIGYGAGYYDRALPAFPDAVRVAVIYDFQLIVEVPPTDGDVPVHFVVTEKRSLTCDASADPAAS